MLTSKYMNEKRKPMDNRPIGLFDSGIGGLTCLPYLRKELPNEKVVYFGDTDRAPYGSKTIEKIEKYTCQIADFLVENDVKMIVIACNTISATCLNLLRKRHPQIPIIGIISPIAKKIAREEKSYIEVGIIGTKVTVKSGAYANIITSKNKDVKVYSKACPLFVPLIEENLIDSEMTTLAIKHYMDDFIELNDLKKVVLGCTHYPLLEERIQQIYPNIELLNPSKEVIFEVKKILEEEDLLADGTSTLKNKCCASELTSSFKKLVKNIYSDENSYEIIQKKFED